MSILYGALLDEDLLAILDDDALVVGIDGLSGEVVDSMDGCGLEDGVLNAIGHSAFELNLVDVAAGSCDGEADDLRSCLQLTAEVALNNAVGAPVVVAGLRYGDACQAGHLFAVDKTDGEA